jgi:hypothetical protein
LLVSELVTNSVIHGTGPIQLRARISAPTLRVEVHDTDPARPNMRQPDLSGRGLHIVDALATAWGVDEMVAHGKSTWFELRHP